MVRPWISDITGGDQERMNANEEELEILRFLGEPGMSVKIIS